MGAVTGVADLGDVADCFVDAARCWVFAEEVPGEGLPAVTVDTEALAGAGAGVAAADGAKLAGVRLIGVQAPSTRTKPAGQASENCTRREAMTSNDCAVEASAADALATPPVAPAAVNPVGEAVVVFVTPSGITGVGPGT